MLKLASVPASVLASLPASLLVVVIYRLFSLLCRHFRDVNQPLFVNFSGIKTFDTYLWFLCHVSADFVYILTSFQNGDYFQNLRRERTFSKCWHDGLHQFYRPLSTYLDSLDFKVSTISRRRLCLEIQPPYCSVPLSSSKFRNYSRFEVNCCLGIGRAPHSYCNHQTHTYWGFLPLLSPPSPEFSQFLLVWVILLIR